MISEKRKPPRAIPTLEGNPLKIPLWGSVKNHNGNITIT